MASYGQIIDMYEPEKDNVYESFVSYFNNPKMIKIKNVDTYSMYMCKLYCLLSNKCRYIVVFIPIDNEPTNHSINLVDMKWVSFQTRTLPDQHNLYPHSYDVVAKGPLKAEIERIKITDKASTYKCEELGLVITLLHTETNSATTYQDKGSVIAALETWETIVTFN